MCICVFGACVATLHYLQHILVTFAHISTLLCVFVMINALCTHFVTRYMYFRLLHACCIEMYVFVYFLKFFMHFVFFYVFSLIFTILRAFCEHLCAFATFCHIFMFFVHLCDFCRKSPERCGEGAWKVRGRCVEGAWSPQNPSK